MLVDLVDAARLELEGQDAAQVAKAYLIEKGFLK